MVMHVDPQNWTGSYKFQLSKIQDGRHLPSWEIEKRLYLGNGLTDDDQIWYIDAYWPYKV